MQKNLNDFPDSLIQEMSKNLSIKDLIKLSQVNKRLQTIMLNEKAIEYYCYHNNIPWCKPLPTSNMNPATILEGIYYFTQAQQIKEEIDIKDKNVKDILKTDDSLLTSILEESLDGPPDNLTPIQIEQRANIRLSSAKVKQYIQMYNKLLNQATDKKNIMAVIVKIKDEMSTLDSKDLSFFINKIGEFEIQLSEIKSLYGDIINLFLVELYFQCAISLSECSNSIGKNGNTLPLIMLWLLGDDHFKKTLDLPIYPTGISTVEGLQAKYEEECTIFLNKAEEILINLDTSKFSIHESRFALKLLSTDNTDNVDSLCKNYLNEITNMKSTKVANCPQ